MIGKENGLKFLIESPTNIIAGIGSMSEFSMMPQGIPWPISYRAFTIGLGIAAWII